MPTASLLGVLILDRDPYVFKDFLGLLQAWLQDAGGFAFVGLLVYILYALQMPADQAKSAQDRAGVSKWMLGMMVLSLGFLVAYLLLILSGQGADQLNVKVYSSDPGQYIKYVPPKFSTDWQPLGLMLGGLFALLGIGEPFARSLLKVRFRRLWALTILGFREAWRARLLWVFLLILVPFLFPVKWFVPVKPEDELRATLAVTAPAMNLLLLVPAAILAAFSIPGDIKNQNLYTVVTKPVERFEIVFGRFVGYVALMSAALVLMTAVSWLFIRTTTVDAKARDETMKARVPVRGELTFASRRTDFQGTNVGREFDYRKYLTGDPTSSQRAVWSFADLPAGLATGRDHVPCEFTFDIFRLTKGVENRGVDVTVRVVSWQAGQVPPREGEGANWKWADPAREAAYQDRAKELVRELRNLPPAADVNPASVLAVARPGSPEWGVVNKLTAEFGFYELTGKEVFDFRPAGIAIPVGVFQNALQDAPKPGPDGRRPPRLQVFVKCQTGGQMLGMAEGDLYLLVGERSFDQNYFKAAVGLWCRMVILIGLAVVLSTYLAAEVSLLGAALLFLSAYTISHIVDVSSGQSYAGGPTKALTSLLKAEAPTAQVDDASVVNQASSGIDQAFSWMVRRYVNMVPDVESFSWTTYVAEGFDVPAEALVMNVLVMVGYLLPWFILGYYLMRSREVAE